MRFGSLVELFVKAAIAAIPALLILIAIGGAAIAFVVTWLGVLARH